MRYAEWVKGGQHVTLAGHSIFHRQDGPVDGSPVTLLHGYPSSSHDWTYILPSLIDAGFRVTTLDFLGFGASDKPLAHDYLMTEQADIVEALWRHLGIDETALVSHDYGVSVAQELLARDPGRITRTAWLNGGLYIDLYHPMPVQRAMIGPVGKAVGPLMFERGFAVSLRKVLGREISAAEMHDMWLAMSSNGGKRVQWGLNRYHAERRKHAQRWQRSLETYSGPMLFVWGPADPVSGGHVLPRLRERMPQASFVVLDEPPVTGHYPQVENPAPVAAALTEFLGK
ncbi:alpha/beta fold hydrolase [Nocardia huaxiensis]|uniref:Alpha/beta hydrolase n=1 Tax=Nocardia huaxiensis TaxID=2755382 RepID=A0A7D6V8P8_9NOCA|nr:alpha/beta hydrolase [Nocardia huaxiensis]QLY29494.1 alpha/beta hydrolase [Nocardia huaxiensis]UFS96950.1 alpha/beta hydrolase [Nocardia huaxiensis]